ncbi:MAG: TetR/AcrR family transcriptional regulator [Polyangiaceae bacterium]|nr:TetR/AcrR family transcriptional regulator [Polyangiaceae bacterium]
MSFRESFQHREKLLAAAIEAFVGSGFEGASINAILTTAGMSKGQFYHHFRDKEDLYFGVCEAMLDRKRAFFEAHPVPISDDPFEAIGNQLRAGIAFAKANPDIDAFGRAFLRERGRPIFTAALRKFSLADHSGLRDVLARGFARGAFHSGFSPRFVVRAMSAVLTVVDDLLDADNPEAFEEGLSELVMFLRRGLGAGGSTCSAR